MNPNFDPRRVEVDMTIHGYRTNEDGTETLAYTRHADGTVTCIHNSRHVCADCIEADERLR